MSDVDDLLAIEQRIAIVKANLSQLLEVAAGYSGGGDLELASDQIAAEEDELTRLTQLRDSLQSS